MRKLRFYSIFLFARIKPQLSHWISWVLDIVWWPPDIYSIEPSPDYKQVNLVATQFIWFLLKLTRYALAESEFDFSGRSLSLLSYLKRSSSFSKTSNGNSKALKSFRQKERLNKNHISLAIVSFFEILALQQQRKAKIVRKLVQQWQGCSEPKASVW